MNKFENILIISDFDGTFAGKDGRIEKENCDAIRYFIDNGGHFTFASGRGPSKMKELFPEFSTLVNAPMIMVNGELLYDPETDTILEEHPFDSALAVPTAREILQRFPELTVLITDGEQYTSERMPDLGLSEDWRMMTFFGDSNVIKECYREYHDKLSSILSVRCPSPYLIDNTRIGIHKGAFIPALKRWFEAKGITELTVFCVGDYGNDVDMLKAADVSCCPSNAIADVKDICHHILCDHDEGAIADLIRLIEENYI